MRNLYIDCDGVILDTVKFAFLEMKSLGIDITNQEKVTKYFKEIDWNYLIDKGGVLNNSLEKIKTLNESNLFNLVCILTHRCSYLEGVVKTNNFKETIPGVKVITVPKKIQKHHAVNSHGNILIDDAVDKVLAWVIDGGIGILFKEDIDTLIMPFELNDKQPYFITNNLLDIIDINNLLNEVKVYKK